MAYQDVEAIAKLVSAADKIPYYTGSGTAALSDFTSIGRQVVGKTTVQLLRDYLGYPASDVSFVNPDTSVTTVQTALSKSSKKSYSFYLGQS
jgi:hypothetical protein